MARKNLSPKAEKKQTDNLPQPFVVEAKKVGRGRPRKFETSDDLRDAFLEYCRFQLQRKRPITKTSFKAYILVAHGYFYGLGQEFSEALKKIESVCKAYAEEELFVGKNVAGVIFNLCNNYPDDYKNSRSFEHTGKDGNPLFDAVKITIDNGNKTVTTEE